MELPGDDTDFDTDRLPVRRRAASWREAVCSTFVSVDCRIEDAESFAGSIMTRHLADLRISRVRSGPHEVHRSATDRASDASRAVLIGYQRRGTSRVAQDGRTAVLKPGQFALYDTARPYRLHLGTACDQIVLRFPADLAEARFGRTRDLTARTIGDGDSLGQLAGAVFRRLGRAGDAGGAVVEHHLRDAASSVIAANVAAATAGMPDPQRSGRALTLMRAKAFLDDNLGRDDLTTREAAVAVGVSVRYLQELFQADGTTVMSFVWTARLERARHMLDSAAWRGASISEIALACGFKDFSHFGRRFREVFGQSARDLRKDGRDADRRG